MTYITTNIRLPKDLYDSLKLEALQRGKSFGAIVRERVAKKNKNKKVDTFFEDLDRLAKRNAQMMKGKSLSKMVIEMRYEQ